LLFLGHGPLCLDASADKPRNLDEQHQVDGGLGSADAWDNIFAATRGHPGATEHPDTAANDDTSGHLGSAAQREIGDQPQAAASAAADS